MKQCIDSICACLCCSFLVVGDVNIQPLQVSSYYRAVGADINVTTNITLSNPLKYPISIAWHFKGKLIGQLFITNGSNAIVSCTSFLCEDRISIRSQNYATHSSSTVVMSKLTIKKLEQADDRAVVLLSYQYLQRSAIFSVKTCIAPSVIGAASKASHPICGYKCSITFRCKHGYHTMSSNSSTVVCKENARIDKLPSLDCKITSCRISLVPDNSVSPLLPLHSLPFNHRMKFLCKVGYRGSGATYECGTDGNMKLISPPPQCQAVACETATIKDKTVRPTTHIVTAKFSERVQFECREGFVGIGASYVCNAGGTFALLTNPAVCVEKAEKITPQNPARKSKRLFKESSSTPFSIVIAVAVLCVVLAIFVVGMARCKIMGLLGNRRPSAPNSKESDYDAKKTSTLDRHSIVSTTSL